MTETLLDLLDGDRAVDTGAPAWRDGERTPKVLLAKAQGPIYTPRATCGNDASAHKEQRTNEMRAVRVGTLAVLLVTGFAVRTLADAQDPARAPFKPGELEQIAAPVALYPPI
jgi:hypothetical protein